MTTQNETITTKTIAEELAKLRDISTKDALADVQFVLSSIKNAVVEGTTVRLDKFGIFTAPDTEEKQCRNPRTGDLITVPASRRVSFKASTTFKNAVKGA